ncbi:DUF1127 domain-containing protein [Acidisoma sp.]|uniref:DUF1127 domain-containing protein n=1 Tax=Acidisoma sp. TaxID=1872115 RepID=UPI003AFF8B90
MSLSLGTTTMHWPLSAALSRLWQAARDAQKRMKRAAAPRRELDCMDARMLSDIGVSRAQLHFEIDRHR